MNVYLVQIVISSASKVSLEASGAKKCISKGKMGILASAEGSQTLLLVQIRVFHRKFDIIVAKYQILR